ncbi:MAG: hypothetical protein K2O88_07100, partial [Paramuribaculum sp.]|nr:hypothetical protein [Paramuribaculum sp.]
RYDRFIKESYGDKNFNEKRMKSYVDLLCGITRFLKIKHLEKISADEFTADLLKELSDFFVNEYKYVERYKRLYAGLKGRAIPKAPRAHNTIVTRLNKVQAFFNHLLEREEIEVSPFYKLGKKRRAQMMKEEYDDDPVNLNLDELITIIKAEVPESLSETRDAFVFQCALGLRISEFKKMTMEKIDVTEDGIPYIHYLPSKTIRGNKKKIEIQTPLVLYALEIIKKYKFNFRILKYVSGKSGYNVKIRQLLKHCGIERKVKVFNEAKADNEFFPIHERASSKCCRATFVHLMDSVQINHYVTGIHKPGSNAVFHYNRTGLGDLFALMCAAYSQPLYKADKDLNVLPI